MGAIYKRNLLPGANKYLGDFLKMSGLEVVPIDQIKDLCNYGILRDVSEAYEVTKSPTRSYATYAIQDD